MIGRFAYFLGKAYKSMLRAPLLTMATVGMLAVVFLLFNCFAIIANNISVQTSGWISSVKMTVFLKSDVTPEDAQNLSGEFRKLSEVAGVMYVTQDDARKRFLADFPGASSIMDDMDKNPLPSSLELELTPASVDNAMLESLATKLRANSMVEDALYGKELFSKLSALVGLIRLISSLIGMGLVIAAVFLTANTIRLNLYARQEEMRILQLVGGTRWFIRFPYLLEGFLQGFSGALLAILMAYGIYHISLAPISEVLAGSLGNISLLFLPTWMIVAELMAGALLGALGSFIALGQFWRLN